MAQEIDISDGLILTAQANVDWDDDKTDHKSISSNHFKLGKFLIQRYTEKQTFVALSSAEAEYILSANLAQTITWLKLLKDFDFKQPLTTTLYKDNILTIKMISSNKL